MFPNYEDIPSCSSCNDDDTSDGSWPGDVSSLRLTENDERDLNLAVGLNADGSDPDADPELFSRDDWVATMSSKVVTACGTGSSNQYWLTARSGYGYPAFPANPKNDWDGIENGRWDTISKYWGNTSSICTNWETGALQPHDTAWVNGVEVRDRYQSIYPSRFLLSFFYFLCQVV
jgi:chitinase